MQLTRKRSDTNCNDVNETAYCIDCFKCVTRNGSNRDCEDPFNNSSTVPENQVIPDEYLHDKVYLQTPCQTFIQKRKKVYPALVCAKMIGTLGK
mgnify:CR=1 FL=1